MKRKTLRLLLLMGLLATFAFMLSACKSCRELLKGLRQTKPIKFSQPLSISYMKDWAGYTWRGSLNYTPEE